MTTRALDVLFLVVAAAATAIAAAILPIWLGGLFLCLQTVIAARWLYCWVKGR